MFHLPQLPSPHLLPFLLTLFPRFDSQNCPSMIVDLKASPPSSSGAHLMLTASGLVNSFALRLVG
eukprot:jgi/Botrbrau1/1047/Bobra.0076s0014.1